MVNVNNGVKRGEGEVEYSGKKKMTLRIGNGGERKSDWVKKEKK